MPYFNVRVSNTITKDFIVDAVDSKTALRNAQLAADGNDSASSTKNVIELRHDHGVNADVVTASKSEWADALKKKKAK
jgi:hypothetical protein